MSCTHVAATSDQREANTSLESDERIGLRINRLAHALDYLGVGLGSIVVIACCSRHREDATVAAMAVHAVSAERISLAEGDWIDVRPTLVLACSEGVEWWHLLGVTARIVSDVPGTLWWRVLENTQVSTPFRRHPPPAIPAAPTIA